MSTLAQCTPLPHPSHVYSKYCIAPITHIRVVSTRITYFASRLVQGKAHIWYGHPIRICGTHTMPACIRLFHRVTPLVDVLRFGRRHPLRIDHARPVGQAFHLPTRPPARYPPHTTVTKYVTTPSLHPSSTYTPPETRAHSLRP